MLVTCDASAYCCAFAGAHSICCWRLCGPGTLPGIDVEKLERKHFSPTSLQFKSEINGAFPCKRHQKRHLEFCTAYCRSMRSNNGLASRKFEAQPHPLRNLSAEFQVMPNFVVVHARHILLRPARPKIDEAKESQERRWFFRTHTISHFEGCKSIPVCPVTKTDTVHGGRRAVANAPSIETGL